MRIAVTDYDGTLLLAHGVPEATVESIRRWRNVGNIFGIATGRDLSMVLAETDKWGIPFDFLLCCNGAAAYGSGKEVLWSVALPDNLTPRVLRHPAAQASLHWVLCASGQTHLALRDPGSWFPALGVPFHAVDEETARQLTGMQQISFSYADKDEAALYAGMLNEAFGHALYAHHNGVCIDITRTGVGKAAGMDKLLRLRRWPPQGLLAIGDGGNDQELLRRYRGYAVCGAAPEARAAARGEYADVGAMLNAHLDEE